MIIHTVQFRLSTAAGSPEEAEFLDAVRSLAAIDGGQNFQLRRVVNEGSPYDYGFSVEFADAAALEKYNVDVAHVAFIEKYWIPQAKDFIGIDFEPLS